MPYTKQTWVDNVTPVDAARMLHVEDGVEMQVDVDSVVAAAGQLVATKLLLADANPAFKIVGDGTHSWGPGGATAVDTTLYRHQAGYLRAQQHFMVGYSLFIDQLDASQKLFFGSALDTNLYRYASGSLKTDGYFYAVQGLQADNTVWLKGASVGSLAIATWVGAETKDRFEIYTDGKHAWGTGAVEPLDTTLYRLNVGQLMTGKSFVVGDNIYMDNNGLGAKLFFGSALDTNLYRNGANSLRTDGTLVAGTAMQVYGPVNVISAGAILTGVAGGGDTNYRFVMGNNGTMNFGPGNAVTDTNLYRGGANQLNTDDAFYANSIASLTTVWISSDLFVDQGGAGAKLYFGSAIDTNLYRAGADLLKTDDHFISALSVRANDGLANQVLIGTDGHINFGSAQDTNLYRLSAGVLKTDGKLIYGLVGARVRRTTAQTLPNGTLTAINWTSENFDTDNMWTSGDPTNFTVQTTGVYIIGVNIRYAVNSGGTARNTIVTVDGVRIIDHVSNPNAVMAVEHNLTVLRSIAAGSKVQVACFHDAGSNVDAEAAGAESFPQFWMAMVGR